jgi:hypothetical protein
MGLLSSYQNVEVRVRDMKCLILRRLLSVLSRAHMASHDKNVTVLLLVDE